MFADFLHVKKECGADELEGVADAVCLEVDLFQQMIQDQEGALENHSDQLENGSKVLISRHSFYYLSLANIRDLNLSSLNYHRFNIAHSGKFFNFYAEN
jgi:hypothetical protein